MVYVLAGIGMVLAVYIFICSLAIVGDVWETIKEYEEMKSKGYTLMKSDSGDDFWVGYGDQTFNGDTRMYQFDFISVAFGYIVGILLSASMSHIMYMEENDENQ